MTTRPPRDEDLARVLALLQATDTAVLGVSDWTEADLRVDWADADLERDAWLVEVDGRTAGYALLEDRGGGRFVADGYVHPELAGRGVGTELLRRSEARARELVARGDGRAVLHNGTLAGDPRAPALFACNGYAAVRHVYRMVAELGEEPPAASRPDGAAVEPYDPGRDAHAVHATVEEAFAREWAYRPQSFEEFERRRLGARDVDTTLWWVARAGGEVVGAVLADAKRNGPWGWIGSIGVRDAWRRRGIGEALLRAAFRELHRRGERRVALGVDVRNPTGATRLYERVGMRVLWDAVVYEKVLRG